MFLSNYTKNTHVKCVLRNIALISLRFLLRDGGKKVDASVFRGNLLKKKPQLFL